jgi:20S proteasome alpha/beta subunit
MTLCVAAICTDNRKHRIVVATDWRASTGAAGAENQDKLRWITPNMPVLLAGTVSRAIELRDTYRQYFKHLSEQSPPVNISEFNVMDVVKKPTALFKRKLVDEYTGLKFGLGYKEFRQAVANKEIPKSVATEAFTDIKSISLDCCLILPFFIGRDAYIFKVDEDGSVEECDNFAAIGSGSDVAEGSLFQRQQEEYMTLGRTVYHVYEAMRLGSIASDVGQEHTIDVLYPPMEGKNDMVGETTTKKADAFLAAKFKKLGPKKFVHMPLPDGFWQNDF